MPTTETSHRFPRLQIADLPAPLQYIETTIPEGMTIPEYRKSRPSRPSRWQRLRQLGGGVASIA